jgi:RHS repeat-associated protein
MDGVGTTRRLVTSGNTAWDKYELDAFGADRGSWTNYHNPYRFGGAWGYITDTPGSGLLQLGARFYWPEVGRFVQGDPLHLPGNRYVYTWDNPLVWVDPAGWWGAGIGVSWSAEGGGWDLGLGATAATGTGVFWGGPQGVNTGAWADVGGYMGTTTEGLAYPETGAPHAAAGAYAGVGGMVWFTNAKSVQDLAGPFHNINVNVGVGPFKCSVQFAWSGGVRMVSVGPPFLGLGGGVSVSTYDTCAVVVP